MVVTEKEKDQIREEAYLELFEMLPIDFVMRMMDYIIRAVRQEHNL